MCQKCSSTQSPSLHHLPEDIFKFYCPQQMDNAWRVTDLSDTAFLWSIPSSQVFNKIMKMKIVSSIRWRMNPLTISGNLFVTVVTCCTFSSRLDFSLKYAGQLWDIRCISQPNPPFASVQSCRSEIILSYKMYLSPCLVWGGQLWHHAKVFMWKMTLDRREERNHARGMCHKYCFFEMF